MKAYSWVRAMGADGIREAADLSVLANNYMETAAAGDPRRDEVVPAPDQHRGWR